MENSKDSLILSHLDLAKDIAVREWRTATHAYRLEDMQSLAYEGLVDAAVRWVPYCVKNSYDPEATQYFKVFASFRIRGTIRDYIRRDQRWATRTLRTKAKKLKEAGQDEGLSLDELSEKTGIPVAQIHKINARLALKPISLDAHLNATREAFDGSSLVNDAFLKDPADTEGSAFSNDMINVFIRTLKRLPNEELLILVLKYYSKLDIKEIAETLGISESKVSQLHNLAITAIQESVTTAAQEN